MANVIERIDIMGVLDSETLKKRLRYQGGQYGRGKISRGGSNEPHMFTQAADRIELLEEALTDLLNDCINFDGSKLTDVFMEKASKVLKE